MQYHPIQSSMFSNFVFNDFEDFYMILNDFVCQCVQILFQVVQSFSKGFPWSCFHDFHGCRKDRRSVMWGAADPASILQTLRASQGPLFGLYRAPGNPGSRWAGKRSARNLNIGMFRSIIVAFSSHHDKAWRQM